MPIWRKEPVREANEPFDSSVLNGQALGLAWHAAGQYDKTLAWSSGVKGQYARNNTVDLGPQPPAQPRLGTNSRNARAALQRYMAGTAAGAPTAITGTAYLVSNIQRNSSPARVAFNGSTNVSRRSASPAAAQRQWSARSPSPSARMQQQQLGSMPVPHQRRPHTTGTTTRPAPEMALAAAAAAAATARVAGLGGGLEALQAVRRAGGDPGQQSQAASAGRPSLAHQVTPAAMAQPTAGGPKHGWGDAAALPTFPEPTSGQQPPPALVRPAARPASAARAYPPSVFADVGGAWLPYSADHSPGPDSSMHAAPMHSLNGPGGQGGLHGPSSNAGTRALSSPGPGVSGPARPQSGKAVGFRGGEPPGGGLVGLPPPSPVKPGVKAERCAPLGSCAVPGLPHPSLPSRSGSTGGSSRGEEGQAAASSGGSGQASAWLVTEAGNQPGSVQKSHKLQAADGWTAGSKGDRAGSPRGPPRPASSRSRPASGRGTARALQQRPGSRPDPGSSSRPGSGIKSRSGTLGTDSGSASMALLLRNMSLQHGGPASSQQAGGSRAVRPEAEAGAASGAQAQVLQASQAQEKTEAPRQPPSSSLLKGGMDKSQGQGQGGPLSPPQPAPSHADPPTPGHEDNDAAHDAAQAVANIRRASTGSVAGTQTFLSSAATSAGPVTAPPPVTDNRLDRPPAPSLPIPAPSPHMAQGPAGSPSRQLSARSGSVSSARSVIPGSLPTTSPLAHGLLYGAGVTALFNAAAGGTPRGPLAPAAPPQTPSMGRLAEGWGTLTALRGSSFHHTSGFALAFAAESQTEVAAGEGQQPGGSAPGGGEAAAAQGQLQRSSQGAVGGASRSHSSGGPGEEPLSPDQPAYSSHPISPSLAAGGAAQPRVPTLLDLAAGAAGRASGHVTWSVTGAQPAAMAPAVEERWGLGAVLAGPGQAGACAQQGSTSSATSSSSGVLRMPPSHLLASVSQEPGRATQGSAGASSQQPAAAAGPSAQDYAGLSSGAGLSPAQEQRGAAVQGLSHQGRLPPQYRQQLPQQQCTHPSALQHDSQQASPAVVAHITLHPPAEPTPPNAASRETQPGPPTPRRSQGSVVMQEPAGSSAQTQSHKPPLTPQPPLATPLLPTQGQPPQGKLGQQGQGEQQGQGPAPSLPQSLPNFSPFRPTSAHTAGSTGPGRPPSPQHPGRPPGPAHPLVRPTSSTWPHLRAPPSAPAAAAAPAAPSQAGHLPHPTGHPPASHSARTSAPPPHSNLPQQGTAPAGVQAAAPTTPAPAPSLHPTQPPPPLLPAGAAQPTQPSAAPTTAPVPPAAAAAASATAPTSIFASMGSPTVPVMSAPFARLMMAPGLGGANASQLLGGELHAEHTAALPGYSVGKVIGEGGFCQVRLALHHLSGRKVAVKVIDKAKLTDANEAKRIQREIRVMRHLTHECIIKLFQVVDAPSMLYLVMEHAPNGSLLDHVRARKRLAEPDAAYILQQVVAGLEHCHQREVVHRDVKLENILLDADNVMKVIDFGLSAFFVPDKRLRVHCGSPSYAAPEIVARKHYDGPPVDVWSLGVVLFAMLAGYLPFHSSSGNKQELCAKIMEGKYTAPESLSPHAKDILARMLTVDPEKRITLGQLWSHPWVRGATRWEPVGASVYCVLSDPSTGAVYADEQLVDELEASGYPRQMVLQSLLASEVNYLTAAYYLLAEGKVELIRRMRGVAASRRYTSRAATSPLQLLQATAATATTTVGQGSSQQTPATTHRPLGMPQGAGTSGSGASGSTAPWFPMDGPGSSGVGAVSSGQGPDKRVGVTGQPPPSPQAPSPGLWAASMLGSGYGHVAAGVSIAAQHGGPGGAGPGAGPGQPGVGRASALLLRPGTARHA